MTANALEVIDGDAVYVPVLAITPDRALANYPAPPGGNMAVLMMCGCTVSTTDLAGNPSCLYHNTPLGRTPALLPDLTGRSARCAHYGQTPSGRNHESRTCTRGQPCMCEAPSSFDLAFFEYRPAHAHDVFYCGCWGWD